MRREVALPAIEAAGAESAAVGTTDLSGNAKRVAVAGIAVEGGIGRDEDALDVRVIGQPPKKFLGGVNRALFANQRKGLKRKVLGELFAEHLGKVCHRLPAGGAMNVKPFEQLPDAVGGLIPRLELRGQFVAGQGFDVALCSQS